MKRGYKKYYKLAQPDGFDFFTGDTINYRENIGNVVRVPSSADKLALCTDTVIHASRNPNDCFVGAKIPCSAFEAWGIPVVESPDKCGFAELKIIREIDDLDKLFGWSYSKAIQPFHPFSIEGITKADNKHLDLLYKWASVGDSVWASVWASVGASVWASVGDSVWASVWA